MTTYTLQQPPHAGAQLTFSTPASGDQAPTGPGIGLLVINPSGGTTITVSLPPLTSDGLTVGPRIVSILAGATWIIPLPSGVYGAAPVTLTYTGTLTGVLVAAVNNA